MGAELRGVCGVALGRGCAAADSCAPHDKWLASSLRLVIQAITADPPTPESDQEQKL